MRLFQSPGTRHVAETLSWYVESTKRIRVGLIDCFQFYNLIKLLETTSKTTLKRLRGSDDTVTVIPPADYAERFLTATEAYFIDGANLYLSIATRC